MHDFRYGSIFTADLFPHPHYPSLISSHTRSRHMWRPHQRYLEELDVLADVGHGPADDHRVLGQLYIKPGIIHWRIFIRSPDVNFVCRLSICSSIREVLVSRFLVSVYSALIIIIWIRKKNTDCSKIIPHLKSSIVGHCTMILNTLYFLMENELAKMLWSLCDVWSCWWNKVRAPCPGWTEKKSPSSLLCFGCPPSTRKISETATKTKVLIENQKRKTVVWLKKVFQFLAKIIPNKIFHSQIHKKIHILKWKDGRKDVIYQLIRYCVFIGKAELSCPYLISGPSHKMHQAVD